MVATERGCAAGQSDVERLALESLQPFRFQIGETRGQRVL